ncbi:MAG TPA: mechanosensitive ion channel family protein [Pseudonocardia sp.]|nr:mechanosensitive ion channel family protein [Pseudonocardia sp.]
MTGVAPPVAADAAPGCAADAGTWCARLYGWTHNSLVARSADVVIDRGFDILLIIVVAVAVRALLHRSIRRLVSGASNGGWLSSTLRKRGSAGLRELAAPLLSDRRAQRAGTIGSVLRSTVSVLVLVVASIMILTEFGLNPAPLLASAGIVGVAVGFGAQNLVRDFLSGMFMLLEDQYGVGDVVDLGAATGTVEAVGLRITTVRDVHGTVWHVRNGTISRVGNKSQVFAVAVVDVPLAHTADTALATRIAGEVATEVAATDEVASVLLEPPQVLGVESVTMEGIVLRVTAKVQPGRQWAVQRTLNAALTDAFDRAGLPRPSPMGAPSAGTTSGSPRSANQPPAGNTDEDDS